MTFRSTIILVLSFILAELASGQGSVPASPPVDVIVEPTESLVDRERERNPCDYLNSILGTSDFDKDGINNCEDNCVFDRNKKQKDKDNDGTGDACEWRKRLDEEWERTGRHQRQTATEPVDLEELIEESTNILIVRFNPEPIGGEDEENLLNKHFQVSVVRELKGRVKRIPISVHRGIWVYVPDKGPHELVGTGDLLVFLKNGKLRRWKRPHIWTNTPDGKPYSETHYFGYELADLQRGVLGVSSPRIKQIEDILRRKQ